MKLFVRLILLAVLFSIFAGTGFSAEQKKAPAKPLIVDVCTSWEFRQKHYPDAVNIPVDEIEGRIKEFGQDKERQIVLYCASGVRAEEAKEILKEKGYKNVRNAGSLDEFLKDSNSELK